MKKQWIITFTGFLMLAVLSSCSTKVDLFTDGTDAAIVYALLDSNADTNFVKITHTMATDNANINANHPELSNYPGKLDVRLTEYCNGDSVRQIILDTITKHDKEEGLFYSPAQKLYYTTEPLGKNGPGKQFSYILTAQLPDHTLTAEALLVGSDAFYVRTGVVDYSGGFGNDIGKSMQEIWIVPAVNAEIYDVDMAFTFLERRTWTSDTVARTIKWKMGTFYKDELAKHMYNNAFVLPYKYTDLYIALKETLADDTIVYGLRRFIIDDPMRITVTVGGHNLSEYVYVNHLNAVQISEENIVTQIDGGYGVFSSKMTTSRTMRLGGTTVPDLVNNTKWGFKYMGGHWGDKR